jgi:anti-anti-sigma regulatory factor
MLRITVQPQVIRTLLILEGRLAGAWVQELRKVLTRIWSDPTRARIAISLTAVNGMDAAGRELLLEASASGADLIGSGLAARAFIEEIAGTSSDAGSPTRPHD